MHEIQNKNSISREDERKPEELATNSGCNSEPITVRQLGEMEFVLDLRAMRLDKTSPARHLAYRCLLEQFNVVLAEESRALEGKDPEGVHQMRVATRRIRAAFRTFKRVLPSDLINDFSGEFKWVADCLGAVRDLDVYLSKLDEYAANIPQKYAASLNRYEQYLVDQRQNARKQLLDCLSGERYRKLTTAFANVFQHKLSELSQAEFSRPSIAAAALRLIRKQHKVLRKNRRSITKHSPDKELHALRIECKRLRYLFEFFEPFYGKELKNSIRRLRKLQQVLGDFQDACVATQRLTQYAESMPMQDENRVELIALGQLIHMQTQHAAENRAAFFRVWKAFDRKDDRKKLVRLLRTK